MVKKQPIRFRIKTVIEALRKDGKKKWSDLVSLGIPEKTLSRVLNDYLIFWGLVQKEGEYYVWHENLRVFKSFGEYMLAINHSRQLIPALKSILDIKLPEKNPLYLAAKEHLRSGYPEIYAKLEKFESVFTERIRYLLAKHGDKIKVGGRDFMLLIPEVKKRGGFLGKFGFNDVEFKKVDIPFLIEAGKKEEEKELLELRDFLSDAKAFNERFEVYRDLAGDISLLILKIEMGEPLEGKCSPLCPKVRIMEGVKHE
jgi:hypothetical protein